MTVFEKVKQMEVDEVAAWLDEHGLFETSPWVDWFDDTYCKNCESIKRRYKDCDCELSFAWCELHDKCKFFPNMDEVPEGKQIVKLWLESEVEDE